MTWRSIFLLPNLRLCDSIEGGQIVLACPEDDRLTKILEQQKRFKAFYRRFFDQYGTRLEPAAVLRNDAEVPLTGRTMEALASYRDIVALSVIPRRWAIHVVHERSSDLSYSDWFALYPWALDKDYENILSYTPGHVAIWSNLQKFRGTSSPQIHPAQMRRSDIDLSLYVELMNCWRRRFLHSDSDIQVAAILRSLNMAYHAAACPAVNDPGLFDIGRQLSLWVSAFEILVHPINNYANAQLVCAFLQTIVSGKQSMDQMQVWPGQQNAMTWPAYVYARLNILRNSFLHGNPVTAADLTMPNPDVVLHVLAAPLYRFALAGALGIAEQSLAAQQMPAGYFSDPSFSFFNMRRLIDGCLTKAMPV